jgi:hypothetical protein
MRNGEVISVYWRYLIMYIIMMFKFVMIEEMYQYFCKTFDVHSDVVHVIKNVEYVDRYIIYENKDSKYALRNTINFLEYNKYKMKEIILPRKIILKCILIDDDKEIDLKSIFLKYTNVCIDNHTIGNILLFNNLRPSCFTKIKIAYRNGLKLCEKEFQLSDMLRSKIDDLFV